MDTSRVGLVSWPPDFFFARCTSTRAGQLHEGRRDDGSTTPEKEELRRLRRENKQLLVEAESMGELQDVTDRQMRYHNRERRHSGIDYQPPLAYLESEGIAA